MIRIPKMGARVIVRYQKKLKPEMPLEGKIGTVVVICRAAKCRNHGILIDGQMYAIPAGNLSYVRD